MSAEQKAANMSLAQYAQICAEVRTAPEKSGEIRARLGFDNASWTALHKLFDETRVTWQRADSALRHA